MIAVFVAVVATVEASLVSVPASAILFVAALVAIYTVVGQCPPRRWLVIVPVSLVAATVTELRDLATRSVVEALPTFAVIGAVVVLAVVVRRSREQSARLTVLAIELARSRAEAQELATIAERLRIARDMHDVLAHSVSVMVLQTGAARMALHDREGMVRTLLVGIEDVGRDALQELRSILGVLRDNPSSASTHADGLNKVVDTMRSAGLQVELDVRIAIDRLVDGVGEAVVRVVQEGLTNSLKHGAGAAATVLIDATDTGVQVSVRDRGGAVRGSAVLPAGGHGLLGITERVTNAGGSVEFGPLAGGGWQLAASIPDGRNSVIAMTA